MSGRFFAIVVGALLALLATTGVGLHQAGKEVSKLTNEVARLGQEKEDAGKAAKAQALADGKRHSQEIKNAKDDYEKQLKIYEDGYSGKLAVAVGLRQQSEERAALYRRQAAAGSDAAAALADHTAALDASLAEGREVVIGLQRALDESHALLTLAIADSKATRQAVDP